MIVSMWMTRDLVTVEPRTPIAEAAGLMAREHIRCLPVLEPGAEAGPLVGIVTANDLLHAFPSDVNPFAAEPPDPRQTAMTCGSIMRRTFSSTTPDTPIEDVARVMLEQKIGSLPVLKDGQVVGVITETDIFRAFLGLIATPGTGARVTFDMSRGEDVFGLIARAAKVEGLCVRSLISAMEGDRPVCVVHVTGERVDVFLEDLWASGHVVVNVLRFR